jgi:hypothetical protein
MTTESHFEWAADDGSIKLIVTIISYVAANPVRGLQGKTVLVKVIHKQQFKTSTTDNINRLQVDDVVYCNFDSLKEITITSLSIPLLL